MSTGWQETEAKFYVRDLDQIKRRIEQLGARLVRERMLETNIRFDLPGAPLRADGRVLRLRRDSEVKLTYKSASTKINGVLSREEIEFVVEDFEKAKRFLEALGYEKLVYYEKYRTVYELHKALIMLDELPYGTFVEIEGETVESIQAIAGKLNLKWNAAIGTSYNALFDRARRTLNLLFQDLSFTNFAEINTDAAHLGVFPADV